jgi:hypothetical protein
MAAYLHSLCGRDGHKILDMLYTWSTNSSARIDGRPVPAAIRLKASEMLLERGWGRTNSNQQEVSAQPLFNLPPGASVAIRLDVPK